MGSQVPVAIDHGERRGRGEDPSSDTTDLRLIAAGVLAGLATLAVAAVVLVARELRPLADDYCLAMWSGDGLFAGVETVLRTWSGDAVIAFSNLLFVGMPLLHLPWSVASALPFFLAALSVGIAACVMLVGIGAFRVRARAAMLVIPVVMVMWWAYWWIPVRHPDPVAAVDGVWDLELAGSITAWQNINSAYIIPTSAWAVVCVLLWKRVDKPLGPGVVLWGLVGLAMGLSGPVLALSFVAALAVIAAVRLVRRSVTRPVLVRYAVLAVCTLGGVIASQMSPGTRTRATFITDTPYAHMNGPLDLLGRALEAASRAWFGMLVGWASLFVLLAAALLAVLLGAHGRVPARRLTMTGAALLLLSFCLHAASAAAEAFAYWGYWHMIVPTLVMFWALMSLGWGAASALASRAVVSWTLAVAGSLALAVVATMAVADMTNAIEDRYDRWARGPAPFGQIYDTSTEYVAKCASLLSQYRQQPPRG